MKFNEPSYNRGKLTNAAKFPSLFSVGRQHFKKLIGPG